MNEVLRARRAPPKCLRPVPAKPSARYSNTTGRKRSAALGRLHAGLERLKHRIGDFAEDIELQLLVTRHCQSRTGAEFSYPGSQGTINSGNHRSPPTPYMIWTWLGLPATARMSQSRHARASS